jgi:succinate dehydrogenase / fumarate reductase cytochrome b subunit
VTGLTATAPASAKDKYYFLIRRLHSLTGLFPVGVFLFFHLTANATINLKDGNAFQEMVNQIHLLDKVGLLVPVEMALIFIPLAFHAIFGVVIVLTGAPNVGAYRYGSNIRYTLQRLTGVIAFFFIIFHVWQMHWLGGDHGGQRGDYFDPHLAPWSAAMILQGKPILSAIIYGVGVVATVFHLANGVWTALITWGITIGPRSQRIAGYACTALGLGLSVLGLGAIRGFLAYDTKTVPPEVHAQTATLVADESPDDGLGDRPQDSGHGGH